MNVPSAASFVSDAFSNWSRELFGWVNERLAGYEGLKAERISSFASGEVLLALLHSAVPTSVDLEKFDRVPLFLGIFLRLTIRVILLEPLLQCWL